MVFGTWTFPAGAFATFRAAELAYPPHGHQEGTPAAAFAGPSTAKKVAAVMTGAKSVARFLRFDAKGDALVVRGVLADGDWVEACARLGAMARAASALGAKGHLTVESAGKPLGRLVLGARAVFDSRTGKIFEDIAGRADLLALMGTLDDPKGDAGARAKPAADRKAKPAAAKAPAETKRRR